MISIILITIAIALFVFFTWFAIVSISEHEPLATKRSFFLAAISPLPFLALGLFSFQYSNVISVILIATVGLVTILLLFPANFLDKTPIQQSPFRIDERDTMFSRLEISRSETKQQEYYAQKPEHKTIDEEWKKKAGLMSDKSTMYSPYSFHAADASFFTIEQLRSSVNGEVNTTKTAVNDKDITTFIKNWNIKLGGKDFGVCELKPEHYYSYRGRGEYYGNKVDSFHKYAIAITVEMDKDFLAAGPAGPTLMESAQQYLDSGTVAIQIAKFIRNLGYEARAHVDGNYEVVCPLVARDAGLGEIGRMGLLMTPTLGPRIRIAVITTNLPLQINKNKNDQTIHHFCKICKKCADVCPSQAISKNNKEIINGTKRWQINQEKCFSFWCTSGTDCGRCMSVCPYSHPNNLLHNMVRWGIANSFLFRHFALIMDDFFYGRKPKPAKIPKWINI